MTHTVWPSDTKPSKRVPVCASHVVMRGRLGVLASSTAIALALAISPAPAQQVIVIDDAQTSTNRGPTIDGDDQITVTENGSITVTGDAAEGIFADGANNVIVVDGRVRVVSTDSTARGIESRGANARITINGTVDGVVAPGGTATIGVQVEGANSYIVNNGTIESQTSHALFATVNSGGTTLVNTGIIRTTDDGNSAVFFLRPGTVINSGLIATSSTDAAAVQLNEGGVVVNTGTIWTTGLNAEGIELSGGVVVTNSGRIISVQGEAISVSDASAADDTINLLAPGFIGGNIDFGSRSVGGTQTTVNIVTGPSHSILWEMGAPNDLAGGAPNFSGSVPWFYNTATQTVATFDPTLLASESHALGDLTRLLSRVGLGAVEGFGAGLGAGFGSGGTGPLAYQPGESYPAGVQAAERAMHRDAGHRFGQVWATVLGGQMDHDGGGTTLDSTIGHFGFAGGTTWQHTPGTTLSAMAGYVMGSNEADAVWAPSFDHDTHTLFASLHGEHQLGWGTFGSGALQFGLTAGYSQIDHNRFVNDNLAPLGESWVSADYGGFFVSPELGFSTDIALESGQTLTPNAGLRYAAQWLGGYSESGAVSPAANATVEDRFVGTLEARAGLDVTRNFAFGTLTGRIGYLGRWSTGDDGASITLNSVTQTVASDTQNLNAATLGATLRSALGETAFLELDANYLLGDTAQGFDGQITVGMAF